MEENVDVARLFGKYSVGLKALDEGERLLGFIRDLNLAWLLLVAENVHVIMLFGEYCC